MKHYLPPFNSIVTATYAAFRCLHELKLLTFVPCGTSASHLLLHSFYVQQTTFYISPKSSQHLPGFHLSGFLVPAPSPQVQIPVPSSKSAFSDSKQTSDTPTRLPSALSADPCAILFLECNLQGWNQTKVHILPEHLCYARFQSSNQLLY